jgi:hypothetical protein
MAQARDMEISDVRVRGKTIKVLKVKGIQKKPRNI